MNGALTPPIRQLSGGPGQVWILDHVDWWEDLHFSIGVGTTSNWLEPIMVATIGLFALPSPSHASSHSWSASKSTATRLETLI